MPTLTPEPRAPRNVTAYRVTAAGALIGWIDRPRRCPDAAWRLYALRTWIQQRPDGAPIATFYGSARAAAAELDRLTLS